MGIFSSSAHACVITGRSVRIPSVDTSVVCVCPDGRRGPCTDQLGCAEKKHR